MFRFLICSFSLVLLYPTAIDLYLVGLPQIAADLGVSESQLHMAFSAYLAGMASTMLLAGKVADIVGRKPVALVGALMFVIASFWGGSAESLDSFVAARFLQGIGAGSCYVVAFAILRDVLDDQRRAKVLSMINGITCIVPVLAPVLGHLVMIRYPWTTLFTLMASMGVFVGILTFVALKETKRAEPNNVEAKHSEAIESFTQRQFVSYLIMTSLAVTSILTYVNISPMVIMTMLGFDRGGYSTVMALTALTSMITSFSAPFALSVFKARTLLITAKCLFVVASVTLLMTELLMLPQTTFFVGFGLICIAFSLGFGVAMSGALAPFSCRAGVASSILGVSHVTVSALYIWVMGVLGVSALMMLVISLALTGVVSLVLILCLPQTSNDAGHEPITDAT